MMKFSLKTKFPKYSVYKTNEELGLNVIPQHWESWKMSHGYLTIGSGTTPKSDSGEYYDGDINWVTTSELRENEIDETFTKITQRALIDYPTLTLYSRGSLAIAMYGATIGRLGIFNKESTVNQACCVFSSPIVFHQKFVFYWLLVRKPVLLSLSSGNQILIRML
jgi:type I restriction enzyme, S subunit